MREKTENSLSRLIDCLNKNREITVSEIYNIIGINKNTIWRYVYMIENAGYLFRYAEILHTIKEIPQNDGSYFSEAPGNEIDYYAERLNRIKNRPIIEFTNGLTFVDCLYLLQGKFKTITTKEFALLTGKSQTSAGTIFTQLVGLGYMRKFGIEYTIIKPIPVVTNQSQFLGTNQYVPIRGEKITSVVIESKPIKKKKSDLSWIAKYANSFERITKDEKNILLNALYSSAVCL